MDSISPLKTHHFPLSPPRFLLPFSLRAPAPRSSSLPIFPRKTARPRCEFEVKGNGAVSGDTDPRLIDRQKALDAAMSDINNSFGKGSVTRLGSTGGALVETFPSVCLTLDFALGGGLPKGRIVEIFGPESSGKTTLALHAIAEVQKLGGNAMLVDAEHAFDPAYSRALGVDIENLIVCQPDHGEMALEIADRMCRSGAIDLICVDSVSALTPRAEIEGEIGMQQIGLQARLMSQALRKMSGNASKAGCTLIFLNQIRYKIGVFYGNPEVTSGGMALKFFASLRLEIRSIGKIKSAKGDEDIAVRVRVRVQKSKVSRPYKQAEFEIVFGEGVSKLGCILDCAEVMNVVAKKGSWYSYGEHRIAIQRLEMTKSDLQTKIAKEGKGNAVLQANLEKRKEALQGRRLALEQVEDCKNYYKKRDLKACLETGLMNLGLGQLPVTSFMDSKTRADLEEIAVAEADINNLKQKATDLHGQLSQQRQQCYASLCESCSRQLYAMYQTTK